MLTRMKPQIDNDVYARQCMFLELFQRTPETMQGSHFLQRRMLTYLLSRLEDS